MSMYITLLLLLVGAYLLYRYILRSANGMQQAVVIDIRPYLLHNSDNENTQGITLIYQLGSGRKGKVNLSESAYQERFPGLQIGDKLIKCKDESIPKKA
ncbi:MAG: hypothetical protein ACYC27_20830 [Armatimonadota bacterium]